MSIGNVDKTTGDAHKNAGNMFDKVGNLTALHTTAKSDAVAAINEVADEAEELESRKADTDMVAADFDATASYTAGNYCVQDGKLYKFKNNHSGAWSSADVDEIKIAGELSSLMSGLTNEDITATFYSQLVSGVTISNQSWVSKCGNHIVGDIVLLSTSAFTSTASTLLKLTHKPLKNIDSFAAGATTEWNAKEILHLYISANDGFIVVQNDTGASDIDVAKIHLDYFTE